MKKLIIGLIAVTLLSGCVNMRTSEKREYQKLERELNTYNLEGIKEKDPVLAGALNVLPGFGNLYLEQYGPFVGNLIFWPASIVWAAPQGFIDATTINKQETLYFYRHSTGVKELETAKEKAENSEKVSAL